MIRRDIFEAEPFDPSFVGWGWEDVEWGMRVSRRHPIAHIDNPATHLGLAPAAAMAAKFEQSAANFARVVAAHGDIVCDLSELPRRPGAEARAAARLLAAAG